MQVMLKNKSNSLSRRKKRGSALRSKIYQNMLFDPWETSYYKEYIKQNKTQKINKYQKDTSINISPKNQKEEITSKLSTQEDLVEKEKNKIFPTISKNKNLKKTQNNQLKIKIPQNKNPHTKGTCICTLCTCGHCKCKNPKNTQNTNKNKKKQKSLYTCDFTPKNLNYNTTFKKQILFKKKKKNFTNNSISRIHYKNRKSLGDPKKTQFKPKNNLGNTENLKVPFPKISLYKENFLNWGNSLPNMFFKPKNFKSKKKLPFIAKSSNKAYGNFLVCDLKGLDFKRKFGKQEFKNPIGPDLKFKMVSSNQEDFKILETKKFWDLERKREDCEFFYPSYQGKFCTSTGDYGRLKPVVCPAKIILSKSRKIEIKKKNEEFDFEGEF